MKDLILMRLGPYLCQQSGVFVLYLQCICHCNQIFYCSSMLNKLVDNIYISHTGTCNLMFLYHLYFIERRTIAQYTQMTVTHLNICWILKKKIISGHILYGVPGYSSHCAYFLYQCYRCIAVCLNISTRTVLFIVSSFIILKKYAHLSISQNKFEFRCFGHSEIHGFTTWFTVDFPGGTSLTTSPYSEQVMMYSSFKIVLYVCLFIFFEWQLRTLFYCAIQLLYFLDIHFVFT